MKSRLTSPKAEPAPLKEIENTGWLILGILGAGSFFFLSFGHTAAIALGGVAALLNFRCLDIYFSRLFSQNAPTPKWWVHALYGGRFLALLAALAGGIGWAGLSVVGVVIGFSVPVIAIILFGAISPFRREEVGGEKRWKSSTHIYT